MIKVLHNITCPQKTQKEIDSDLAMILFQISPQVSNKKLNLEACMKL
jgi:hypothetical protein